MTGLSPTHVTLVVRTNSLSAIDTPALVGSQVAPSCRTARVALRSCVSLPRNDRPKEDMKLVYVATLLVPATLLGLWARRVHRVQQDRGSESGSWFRSPARRAEVGERHPFLVLCLVMMLVCSPLPLHAILTGRAYLFAFGVWLLLSAMAAGLTVYLGNRKDRAS